MSALNYGDTFTLEDFLGIAATFAPELSELGVRDVVDARSMESWFEVVGIKEDGTWIYRYLHPKDRRYYVVVNVRKGTS